MSLIEHANKTIEHLKEENEQLIQGIYATKLVVNLQAEIESLRAVLKMSSGERWSWSENKTEEIRQLTLRGPEVAMLFKALEYIQALTHEVETETKCKYTLSRFKRLMEVKP